ncbi:hypothetical protein GCM10028801_30640 [Nocardioides maradonensis]
MADLTFNYAKGKVAYYASLPGSSDALIAVVLEASGLVSDATMRDYDNLYQVLAGGSDEQTTMGRKTLGGVSVTINDTNDRVEVDAADVTWPAASGNPTGALLICYDPDTTSGNDTNIIPLVKLDFARTPSGTDITAVFATGGFYWAS